jgi:hypothetical protein
MFFLAIEPAWFIPISLLKPNSTPRTTAGTRGERTRIDMMGEGG